ncbi:uncharacterized protein LOC115793782 [Archocentrus centrarchus]|uniref:uncharacterized protein LOC115793782 n=1 Tax=Archocentrus centrarchus TaxID=63155 RepID=UPI0011EA4843|nr:uncharacterized protein LOC115793782 [Archocentrus centrarchus]
MAEESSVYELEQLEKQLQTLFSHYSNDERRGDGEPFCSDFCKLVEEYASRWQVPLPQLRILEIALCYFARASSSFASNCDHVLRTLSSLALSVFELLLFFDQKDFYQEPLKHFTDTFQECYLALATHQNVHLLQVERLVQSGGPWANPALQAILSESSLPQNEVDGYISSELPVFFELRVRYLLSYERINEAAALAKCCSRHPDTGQHLFFLQVYLTWLYKTSQHDCLHKEVTDLNGKNAVHLICNLEFEEKDELLLALSTAFLTQQLWRGDMYCLCDLVFLWTKLHTRLNTSKQALLEETRQLMLSATNVNSIFPFIRAILQEVGEDGIQFCVELCANALKSCLPCDVLTKSLIYKTIAGLLHNDLEVCRACALLVFFLERTVESYKMVYLLYMHPDQEYHAENSSIGNNVRFEMLQVLKKDLYFDPEFWNLIALRTNCLKLMNEKGVSAALEEIMEDKWISNYCTKDSAFRSSTSACQKGSKSALQAAAKKRHHKEDPNRLSKRLRIGPGKTPGNVDHSAKKKGSQGSRPPEPLRRSFWQLDRIRDNVAQGYEQHRRITRLSERNLPKRRIRKPKWLLEDSGTLEENVPLKVKRHGFKHEKHHQSSLRSETGHIKNNTKHKSSVNSHSNASEDIKYQKGFSLDCLKPDPPPQVILELSLPDNELMGTFNEDVCNRQRGFPQVLLYKSTVKLPATLQPVKTVHRNEVILRARDTSVFVQQLHCYARRQKGKGNGLNIHSSVSTITRSSVQGSPPKDPPKELCGKPAAETKAGIASRATEAGKDRGSRVIDAQTVSGKTSSVRELSEKCAIEMKASLAPSKVAAGKVAKSPVLHKMPQAEKTGKHSESTLARKLPEKSASEMEDTAVSSAATQVPSLDEIPQVSTIASTVEACEEPTVEMKVTIASKSTVLGKPPTAKDFSKAEVSQSSTSDKNQKKVTDKIHQVSNKAIVSKSRTAGRVQSQCQDGEQEFNSVSSQSESGINSEEVRNDVCGMDVTMGPHKGSRGHVPCKNESSPGRNKASLSKLSKTETTYTHTDQDSISDISSLTLVTEMVTDLPPGHLARDLKIDKERTPTNSASKDLRVGNKPRNPQKMQTTSSCSLQQQEASVVDGTAQTQDDSLDTCENSEFMETPLESEESKLEYCCTFCKKDFIGPRVVEHAMFHYRKDECMFCGTVFTDDLLAMMHLSDHIEKLKRIKAQENGVPDTKDVSMPKTKANTSSGCQSKGRPRKSAACPKSVSPPLECRKLRSTNRSADGSSSQEKQNMSKHLISKTLVHKVNGHIDKKKKFNRLKSYVEEKSLLVQDVDLGSSSTSVQADKKLACSTEDKIKVKESLQGLKKATKQNGKGVAENDIEPHERVSCPADGCSFFTDLSKNRVALLYHALDDHHGELKPLELAFHVGNNKCSICMRVLWSFEHFRHHVERHRQSPRHPCLHQGCTARFKTGMEMRRHARKHSPLQAVCCLPGCSQLFICLWALNLHEREHYGFKSTKPEKDTNAQGGDKHSDLPVGKKQQSSGETAPKLREHASQELLTKKQDKAAPLSTGSSSLIKQKLIKEIEDKDSNVLKNLSNKDTSPQPTDSNLRLKHTLRKGHGTSTTLTAPKIHKVISSSLSKHSSKVRHNLKKKKQVKVNTKGPKRRGRPPKLTYAVDDENTDAGQNSEMVKGKTALHKSQKSTAQLHFPERAVNAMESNKLSKEKHQQAQDGGETGAMSTSKSKSKKSVGKEIRRNHVKLKPSSFNSSKQSGITISGIKRRKSLSRWVKIKNHSAPPDLKKSKIANSKDDETFKKNLQPAIPSALKTHATSKSAVPDVEARGAAVKGFADEGKTKVENKDLTQKHSGDSVLSVPAASLNVSPTTEKAQKLKTEEKSKKSLVKKEDKNSRTASSDSSKAKKHEIANGKVGKKTVKKNCPNRNGAIPSASTQPAKSKSDGPQVEAKAAAVESSVDEGKAKVDRTDSTQNGSGDSVPSSSLDVQPTAQRVQKLKREERSKKSLATKEGKTTQTASPHSGKANKKHKNINKKGDRKSLKADHSKPSAVKKTAKSKCIQQNDGTAELSALDEEGKGKEENSGASKDSSFSSIPAATSDILNEKTCLPSAPEGSLQKVTNKEKSLKKKNPASSKADKKRKSVQKDDTKTVKKQRKESAVRSASKKPENSKAEVSPLTEAKAGTEGTPEGTETPQSTNSGPGYSVITNGQASGKGEDVKSSVFKETLAEYSKKPYMRLPPTAYLDEKYITMPKRRKDVSPVPPYQMSSPFTQVCLMSAVQRQRCASCFATFNSVEELQSHRQLQKCSDLFGFDSDDEGIVFEAK